MRHILLGALALSLVHAEGAFAETAKGDSSQHTSRKSVREKQSEEMSQRDHADRLKKAIAKYDLAMKAMLIVAEERGMLRHLLERHLGPQDQGSATEAAYVYEKLKGVNGLTTAVGFANIALGFVGKKARKLGLGWGAASVATGVGMAAFESRRDLEFVRRMSDEELKFQIISIRDLRSEAQALREQLLANSK